MNVRLSMLAVLTFSLAACGNPKDMHTVKQTNCQVVWSNRGSNAGRYDVYIVDMPQDQWVSGTVTLDTTVAGQERTAIVYDEMDVEAGVYSSRAVALAGEITVTVAGTAPGDAITLSDAGGHSYFDLDANDVIGAQTGDGGASNFSGVWSSTVAGVSLSPGSGSVALTYHGLADTIGFGNANAPLEYSICYEFDTSA